MASDIARRPLLEDAGEEEVVSISIKNDLRQVQDDFADEIWPREDLTLVQKARLFWEEHVVHKKRLPQVYGLILSVVLVLLAWSMLQSSRGGWEAADPIYDDSAKGLESDWTNLRLPKHISPWSYKLSLNANVPESLFDGTIDMALRLAGPTRVIVFHSAGLAVDSIFVSKGQNSVVPSEIKVKPEKEYIVLVFSRPLHAGNWTVKARFSGVLTDSLRGFYRSKVSEIDGVPQYMASTQFQATDARRAFPCLDEPGFKSTFQINITVPPSYSALSNMPEVEKIKTGSKVTHVFAETPKVSTYLIAFVASNFVYVESASKRGVKVRVFTRPGKKDLGKYALATAVKLLEFFEATYKVNYPLPKLDLIAIPDFGAGAMENWGLVTYRETALLFDENLSSAKDKQRVATVIAHEFAHQWFGNLVTMEWWGELWLNEGFASFMEYKGVDSLEPSWRMQDQFLNMDFLKALDADSSRYTHSIAAEVTDPAEIEDIFDDITYAKGASVLRMLEGYIGVVANKTYFFDRISEYLNANAYSNANTDTLWKAVDKSSLDVAKIMNSWISQPGYPVLLVDRDTDGRFTVQQQKFSLFLSKDKEGVKPTWEIPALVQGYGESGIRIGGPFSRVISGSEKIRIDDVTSTPVLLFNFGHKGFFRVMYPKDIWMKLVAWNNEGVLTPVDRVGIMSDAFALNTVGILDDVTIPLEFTRNLKDETDFLVWKFFVSEFGIWDSLLSFEASYGLFQEYQRSLVKPIAIKLGWNETDPDTSIHHGRALMRSEILSEAVALGHH
ncbi:peptidase family M1-domain-containing protein [Chytridium lagenaria]|nr:peptidase family M1-domain-containing protein [Chytridium lagenaria]